MASHALTHLHPSIRAHAGLDNEQRLRMLQRDRWIDYPRATEPMQRLERLRQMPQRERMPCLVLHGRSNIGKTLIIAKFLRDHPPQFDERRGTERHEIISLQMPATPDQRRFYSALLFELGAPQSATTSLASLERVARNLLRRLTPRMLIVDEVHPLLAGSHVEQRASLNLLKYLVNDLKISIVAVGTGDAPLTVQTDSQMSSRFVPFEIPCRNESEEFRRLLRAFEQVLPLRNSSDLAQRPIAQFLLAASAGLLGEISRILTEAAEHAIHDGSERISLELLEYAAYGSH